MTRRCAGMCDRTSGKLLKKIWLSWQEYPLLPLLPLTCFLECWCNEWCYAAILEHATTWRMCRGWQSRNFKEPCLQKLHKVFMPALNCLFPEFIYEISPSLPTPLWAVETIYEWCKVQHKKMVRVQMLKKYTRETRARLRMLEQGQGAARVPRQWRDHDIRAGPGLAPLSLKWSGIKNAEGNKRDVFATWPLRINSQKY